MDTERGFAQLRVTSFLCILIQYINNVNMTNTHHFTQIIICIVSFNLWMKISMYVRLFDIAFWAVYITYDEVKQLLSWMNWRWSQKPDDSWKRDRESNSGYPEETRLYYLTLTTTQRYKYTYSSTTTTAVEPTCSGTTRTEFFFFPRRFRFIQILVVWILGIPDLPDC
jgi:hypothetical protein